MTENKTKTEKVYSGRTVTRLDLAKAVYQDIGLSLSESSHIIEVLLDLVSEQLKSSGQVKISGFGSFIVKQKDDRVGRNPKTGVEVPIGPRKVISFRASQNLKNRLQRLKQAS